MGNAQLAQALRERTRGDGDVRKILVDPIFKTEGAQSLQGFPALRDPVNGELSHIRIVSFAVRGELATLECQRKTKVRLDRPPRYRPP